MSNSVASQIGTASGAPVVRWAGANRFATAASVSTNSFGSRAQTAFVANGLSFPDALAGGPSGGAFGGPMLLTQSTSLPPATAAELMVRNPARIFVLGGTFGGVGLGGQPDQRTIPVRLGPGARH